LTRNVVSSILVADDGNLQVREIYCSNDTRILSDGVCVNGPTFAPTLVPTIGPSGSPSSNPSNIPTSKPTSFPTGRPSTLPTLSPSTQPSSQPTGEPTSMPTFAYYGIYSILNPISNPEDIVVDSSFNVYLADSLNSIVSKVSITGDYSVFAGIYGNSSAFTLASNVATEATLNFPRGLFLDSGEDYLYISDTSNCVVRRVDTSTNIMSIFVGTGTCGYAGDDLDALKAYLNLPSRLNGNSHGDIFIADVGNRVIRKVDGSSSIITTYVGTYSETDDCSITDNIRFSTINDLAFDSSDTLYVLDTTCQYIVSVSSSDQTVMLYAGGGGSTSFDSGVSALEASFLNLNSMDFDSNDNLYITNSPLVKLSVSTGNVTTFVADDGGYVYNILSNVVDIDSANDIYFANFELQTLYKTYRLYPTASPTISPTKDPTVIYTAVAIAGNGTAAGGEDGIYATETTFNEPVELVIDSSNNIYVCDASNYRIRVFTEGGIITTYVGTGASGSTGEGVTGITATLKNCGYMAIDSNDDLYFADTFNYAVRYVDATTGMIYTYAGQLGASGYSGNGGKASDAYSGIIRGLALYPTDGTLYFGDITNYVIRKVTSTGTIFEYYGTPGSFSCSDGYVTQVNSLAVDSTGTLYEADGCGYVRSIFTNINGTYALIVAGALSATAYGDQSGLSATDISLYQVSKITFDSSDILYIANPGYIRYLNESYIYLLYSNSFSCSGFCPDLASSAYPETFSSIYGLATDPIYGDVFFTDRDLSYVVKLTVPSPTSHPTEMPMIASRKLSSFMPEIYVQNIVTSKFAIVGNPLAIAGSLDGEFIYYTEVSSCPGTIKRIKLSDSTLSSVAVNHTFFAPLSIVLDSSSNVYVSDADAIKFVNHEFLSDANIIAGALYESGYVDSVGLSARFDGSYGIALSADESCLYVADMDNLAIRKVNLSSYEVSTLVPPDSKSNLAYISIVADSDGNYIYVTAYDIPAIYRFSLAGDTMSFTVIAGHAGQAGYADGYVYTSYFGNILFLSRDQYDNIYVADVESYTIRVLLPHQFAVKTIAGIPSSQNTSFGDGSSTSFQKPVAVAVVSSAVYVADYSGNLIAQVKCSSSSDGGSLSLVDGSCIALPTFEPTAEPTMDPTVSPSFFPTIQPSSFPTYGPSGRPTQFPSSFPTPGLTTMPSATPTATPTTVPTGNDNFLPTPSPNKPTTEPIITPTSFPTIPSLFGYIATMSASQTMSGTTKTTVQATANATIAFERSVFSTLAKGYKPAILSIDVSDSVETKLQSISFDLSETSVLFLFVLSFTSDPSTNADEFSSVISEIRSNYISNVSFGIFNNYWLGNVMSFNLVDLQSTSSLSVSVTAPIITSVTSAPSTAPTMLPSQQLELVVRTTTTMSIKVTTDPIYNSSGTLYCYASTNQSISSLAWNNDVTAYDVLVRYGKKLIFSYPKVNAITISISSLRPNRPYWIYCGITTLSGFRSATSVILSSVLKVSTGCCADIGFTNAPSYIYSGVGTSFSYLLSHLPLSSVIIHPVVDPLSSTFTVIQSFRLFAVSSTSRVGTFLLTPSSNTPVGFYSLNLNISGNDAASYGSTPLTIQVLSQTLSLPAPTFLSASFDTTLANVNVMFNIPTNRANILSTTFPCIKLFSFSDAVDCSCSWINSTTVTIYGSRMLKVGSEVSLSTGELRSQCVSSSCGNYLNTSADSKVIIQQPVIMFAPTVVFVAPSSVAASCEYLILDLSGSYGHGGREMLVNWTVIDLESGLESANLLAFYLRNLTYKSDFYDVVKIPPSLLTQCIGNYHITATLTNFLSFTSSSSISISIHDHAWLPTLSVYGGVSQKFKSSDLLSVAANAVFTCSNATEYTYSYAYTVLLDNQPVSIPSTSLLTNNQRTLSVAPYTFLPDKTYSVVFTVTNTATAPTRSSSITATIEIERGQVVALIAGGNKRSIPVDGSLLLNASSSYDESYSPSLLSYDWSCSIASQTSEYGNDCTSLIPSASRNNPIATIPAGSLTLGNTYMLTTQVIAPDQRYATSSISISLNPPTISASITTATTKFNSQTPTTLYGSITSSIDVGADWTITDNSGTSTTIPTLTPISSIFTANEASSGISFPISIPAFTLENGQSYTFQLKASSVTSPSVQSFAEVTITINRPPFGGSLTVSPTTGQELTTLFSVVAYGWITQADNYPLSYTFTYIVTSLQPELTLSSKSSANSISSFLPSGSSSNQYNLLLRVYVIDNANAVTNFTTTAKVTSSGGSINDQVLLNTLTTTVTAALKYDDVDAAVRAVNTISGVVSSINCALTSSSYCASLNRRPCEQVINTCGSCLSGFDGVSGPYNAPCFNISLSPTDECTKNEDCLYGVCEVNLCVVPRRVCPTSVADTICSNNGFCRAFDSSNNLIETCLVNDVNCYAQCVCSNGHGGADCSLDSSALEARNNLREELCQSLINISSISTPSGTLIDTVIGALSSSYSPFEVSSLNSQSTCLKALTQIVAIIADGYLVNSQLQTPSFVVQLLSAYLSSNLFSSLSVTNSSDLASTVTDDISSGILATLVDGQEPVLFNFEFINLLIESQRSSSLTNLTLAPPSSRQEIAFVSNGLTSCFNFYGYTRLAMAEFPRNPIVNSSSILNPLLKFSTQATDGSSTDLSSSSSDQVQFYLTLEFSQLQNFTYAEPTVDLIESNVLNQTIPDCVRYDSANGSYVSCNGCVVASFTSMNVTFACTDTSLLCQGGKYQSGRRLAGDDDYSTDDLISLNGINIFNTALFGSIARSFQSTIRRNPFDFSGEAALNAAIFVASLCGILFIGTFYFTEWDRQDHDFIIYIAKDAKLVKFHKSFSKDEGNFVRYNLQPDRSKDDKVMLAESTLTKETEKKLSVKKKKDKSPDHMQRMITNARSMDLSKMKSTNASTRGKIIMNGRKEKETFIDAARIFFDTAMRGRILLDDSGTWHLFFKAVSFVVIASCYLYLFDHPCFIIGEAET
jgi:sugar lactone lactonase YvrE